MKANELRIGNLVLRQSFDTWKPEEFNETIVHANDIHACWVHDGYKSRFGIPRSGTGIFLLFLLSFSTQAQINNKFYHSLEATYIGLNAMDLITTYHGLDRGAEELDPLLKPFINNKPEAILIKSLSIIAVLGVLRSIKRDYPKAASITLISLNIGLSYVVYHNYQIGLTLKF